jgi:hypothetical protein
VSSRAWAVCGGLGVALILALLLLGNGGGGRDRASILSRRAEALAPSYLAERPGEAARLALAGYRLDPSVEGELSMASVAADSARVRRVIETGARQVVATDWAPPPAGHRLI